MATDLDSYMPFDGGPGANVLESGWREMMKHLHGSASGVVRGFDDDFETFGDSTGMQVKVKTGQCWIRGHYGASTAQKTIPIAAADPTNPRKDAVVLRLNTSGNKIEVDVVTGTPAATPAIPTLTTNSTTWETLLAVVDVPAAAVTITAANCVDYRVFTTAYAKFSRSTGQNITSGTPVKTLDFENIDMRAGDIRGNGSLNEFTLLRSGLWVITAQVAYGGSGSFAASNVSRVLQIVDTTSGSVTLAETTVASAGSALNTNLNCSASEYLASGSKIQFKVLQNSGSPINTGIPTRATFTWVGP